MNLKIGELRKKSMSLPLLPGVYIMKNKSGNIIYIGKAKKLKNRVGQYFAFKSSHTPKVAKMVENVHDFDYILTDSEFEALVLECSLIKQNVPKYNILLKDDKGFSYIKITRGWRNIYAVLQKDDEDAEYLGRWSKLKRYLSCPPAERYFLAMQARGDHVSTTIWVFAVHPAQVSCLSVNTLRMLTVHWIFLSMVARRQLKSLPRRWRMQLRILNLKRLHVSGTL